MSCRDTSNLPATALQNIEKSSLLYASVLGSFHLPQESLRKVWITAAINSVLHTCACLCATYPSLYQMNRDAAARQTNHDLTRNSRQGKKNRQMPKVLRNMARTMQSIRPSHARFLKHKPAKADIKWPCRCTLPPTLQRRSYPRLRLYLGELHVSG
jgi:hypothetical protein